MEILDQTELPRRVVRRTLRSADAVTEAIYALRVRGAPLIGIAGAYGAVLAWREIAGCTSERRRGGAWKDALRALATSRPTAVNLRFTIQRMGAVVGPLLKSGASAGEIGARLEAEARCIEEEEAARCRRIGAFGAALVPARARVFTLCNTGGLATGGVGTALGVIRAAFAQGKVAQVWVAETRPLLQGSRLTAFELGTLGVPYRIIADAAVGALFAQEMVDLIVVGADRIASNGDFANKIGTLPVFVLAETYRVPAYVAAPVTTFDAETRDGTAIPIEKRPEDEVLEVHGQRVAPEGARAFNPAFDVTPARYVTAYITDAGVFTRLTLRRLRKEREPRDQREE
jgi:methylthioribose-1-phosphate isomerase